MSEARRRTAVACALVALFPLAAGADESPAYDCMINPSRVVEVASPTAGVLDEVLVDRGDRVAKGQLLARLQSDVERSTVRVAERRAAMQAAIEAATARIEFERIELERRRELRKQDHVAERELQEAEMQTRLAELRLDELRENRELATLELDRTRVILDMKGIHSRDEALVIERYKSPGEFVEEEPIVKLAVVDPLHVETVLSVDLFGRVEEGLRATVIPESPVGGSFPATVTVVDDVIDAATSTFRVRLELPNGKGELPAGLKCVVRFETGVDPSLATTPAGQERSDPRGRDGEG